MKFGKEVFRLPYEFGKSNKFSNYKIRKEEEFACQQQQVQLSGLTSLKALGLSHKSQARMSLYISAQLAGTASKLSLKVKR